MPKEEVSARVLDVVKNFQNVDPAKVTPTSHFINDLGLDSLDTVEVCSASQTLRFQPLHGGVLLRCQRRASSRMHVPALPDVLPSMQCTVHLPDTPGLPEYLEHARVGAPRSIASDR